MRTVDIIMKPFDSYWKHKFRQEEWARKRAEANARCSDGLLQQAEEDLNRIRGKAEAQGVAIGAYNREIQSMRKDLESARAELEKRELEIRMLREVLEAEREAKRALRTARLVIREKNDV